MRKLLVALTLLLASLSTAAFAQAGRGTDAEQKACLEFAEYFCYSAQSVTDEHVADVRAHLAPEKVLGLTSAFWLSDSFHRLSNFLAILRPQESPE